MDAQDGRISQAGAGPKRPPIYDIGKEGHFGMLCDLYAVREVHSVLTEPSRRMPDSTHLLLSSGEYV